MGIFSNFFTGKDDAKAARRSSAEVATGQREKGQFGKMGMESALNYLDPYAQQGQGANALYSARLGADGPQAQTAAMNTFQPSLGLDFLTNYQTDQMRQGRASRGGGNSGLTHLAGQEIFQRNMLNDYWKQMQGLQGLGAQGANVAGRQSDVTQRGHDIQGGAALGAREATAGGILGEQQAYNNAGSRMFGLGANLLTAYMGMPSGGFGSPQGNNLNAYVGQPQGQGFGGQLPWLRG